MKKINDLLLLSFANIGGTGLTAIFWFIIAALLVPSEYGQIQYFLSIAGLAYVISLLIIANAPSAGPASLFVNWL